MSKSTAKRALGIERDPFTGERDLSAESRLRLRDAHFESRFYRVVVVTLVTVLVVAGMTLLITRLYHPASPCDGSQSIVAQSGDSVGSVMQDVPGYASMDSIDQRHARQSVEEANADKQVARKGLTADQAYDFPTSCRGK